ncbi:MAG: phosphoglycerate kinase [Thermoplasmata archaeon]|nr:phosphoglycerate kinase [Thermoplasmata archaeon]
MPEKRSVRTATVRGRRVLLRVDFNVPIGADGLVADPHRILEALSTVRWLQGQGARTILLSHFGRPKGRPDPRFSLRPVAAALSRYLGQPVPLAPDCVGPTARAAASAVENGGCVLLENLRFHPGEEANDPAFAAELASLGELFVEEAFGAVHRAHASTVGIPEKLPSYAGLLVSREMEELGRLVEAPERPYVAIVGGAKVADKLPFLEGLLGRTNAILIGGALAFPFLAADGVDLGASSVEPGLDDAVRAFRAKAESLGTRIELPVDWLTERTEDDGSSSVVPAPTTTVPADCVARDIGPRTRDRFYEVIKDSKSVFWNGPLGLAEDRRFAAGTREVLAGLGTIAGYHVAAGGDSARVASDLGVDGAFQYISTGGGAALEFVAGETLPGLAVLPDA